MNTPVTPPQPIVISMGDPAGIGPEIIAKLFRDAPAEMAGCVVAGDVAAMQRAARCVGGWRCWMAWPMWPTFPRAACP